MCELIFRQAEDGPKYEECARSLRDRPSKVVLRHDGESSGRLVGSLIRRDEVLKLVERCLMDVGEVRRQVRKIEFTRNGSEYSDMLARTMALGGSAEFGRSADSTRERSRCDGWFHRWLPRVIPRAHSSVDRGYRTRDPLRFDASLR